MERLRKSAQFERVRKEGRTWGSGLLVLNAAPNADGVVRCGFITGKKLGKAVGRNRARRLIREAVRLRLPHVAPGWDLVWIGRAQIAGATFWDVLDAVDNLLKRSRVLTVRELPYLHPQTQDGKRETRGAKRDGDTGTVVELNG
jgi:ribonuclease P protein component